MPLPVPYPATTRRNQPARVARDQLPDRDREPGNAKGVPEARRTQGTNGLPLFWMSLLAKQDLGGAWEGDVRARYGDPEDYADGLPPIRVSWTAAGTMLARAEARAQQRVPALASMFWEWAIALRRTADAGAIREIRLYLGDYTNFCNDADDFLRELRMWILIWHGDDEVVLPPLNSVENDLMGVDCTTGIAFPRAMPEWRSDRDRRQHGRSTSIARSRWENVADWGMTLLCAATVLAAMALGERLYGTTGLWLGGVFAIILFALATWWWADSHRR